MAPMIHELSDVLSQSIGNNTRIWQYCVVLPSAKIGSDCNICSNVFIENDVNIGDRVTIKCGVQLWDGSRIHDDVFIGPNVTFTNDPFPRSRKIPEKYSIVTVHQGASIGANATILPNITIGRSAMIAAGSVVTHDVPAFAIVKGNPARIAGYTNIEEQKVCYKNDPISESSTMKGVGLVNFITISDLRGDLVAVELEKNIPFPVKRVFYIMDVPSQDVRGEHAHKRCHQLLVCLRGSVTVACDNGVERQEWVLSTTTLGLHVFPMTWASQYHYTANAILAVFASELYDASDYIRDYEKYMALVNITKQTGD